MSRVAKKSDLEQVDLERFSIGLVEARKLKIMKEDLRGIVEIIPNEKYKIRATTGTRKAETFKGKLLDAIKRKKELNVDSQEPSKTQDDDIMFMEGVRLFIEYCYEREERGEIDINTVYDHIRKIDSDITEFFSGYKLNEVDEQVVEKFITSMRKRNNYVEKDKKLSEQTIANHLRTLNAILNFLFKVKKLIPYNPYTQVTNKPKPKRTKKKLNYFKLFEAKYALKCLDKFADIQLKTFMNIIFSLGCRREEAAGLRWMDIDFETAEVNFNYAVTSYVPKSFTKDKSRIRTKELKTDNSYRTNYLSDVSMNYLKKYYEFKIACGFIIKQEDHIFTTWDIGRNVNEDEIKYTSDNNPIDPNKLSGHWRDFKKFYNIKDVDLHRIRHTVANILEKQGVPKKDIAKMLGNTERVLEEYYTHVDTEDLKRLRNTLDDQLFNDIEYIPIDIYLISKILNNYPMSSLSDNELKVLDEISESDITEDNYEDNIKRLQKIILKSKHEMDYFIEEDDKVLSIKLETYIKFNENHIIRIKKEKEIVINKDVLYI